MPKWAVLQRLSVIFWGLIKGAGQSGGTQRGGFKNMSEFNLNIFHYDVILYGHLCRWNVLCFPGFMVPQQRSAGIKVPACVIHSSLKPPFPSYNLCFGACISVKEALRLWPEAPFPFCNLRPFFTFVPSIGSAYVWFVTSFWVICAAFPHPQLQWRHFPRSPCRNGWVAISTLW